jgi:hypothetical protein
MTIGGDAIAANALGGDDDTVVYSPVSRVIAGGFSSGRPTELAVLGIDLIWDDESIMTWDDGSEIGWEA